MYKLTIDELKALKESLIQTNILLNKHLITPEVNAVIIANDKQIKILTEKFQIS